MSHHMDSHRKSIYKAITWRCVATLTTGVAVLLGGRFLGVPHPKAIALASMVWDIPFKLIIYYFHERVWSRVK